MRLDSFTLLAAIGAAIFLVGVALLYFWNRDRGSRWLLWWGLPLALGGLVAIPYMHGSWRDDLLVAALGGATRITLLAAVWQGARVFGHRPAQWLPVVAAPVAWLALCQIPGFIESLTLRIVVASLAQGVFAALAAFELWRGRSEDLPSRRPAVAVLLSFAILMAVRVAFVNVTPLPVGALPLDPSWMALYALGVFVHGAFLGVLFITLTKERLELAQRNIALVDPLTGLLNRRALNAQIERNARQLAHGPQATAVLVLDIDHFKSVNDRYGHEIGDRVLAMFAAIAESRTRPADRLFRLGGEEFCILLPDTELREALAIGERIRRAFAAGVVETDDAERVTATLSIGIAATNLAGADLDALLAAADAALYEAKARGRNRIVVADTEALRHWSAAADRFERPFRRSA